MDEVHEKLVREDVELPRLPVLRAPGQTPGVEDPFLDLPRQRPRVESRTSRLLAIASNVSMGDSLPFP